MTNKAVPSPEHKATSFNQSESQHTTLQDLVDGLVTSHYRTDANTGELHHNASTLMALVELLVESGLIDPDELVLRRTEIAVNLRKAYVARGMTVAVHESGMSKYCYSNTSTIDCENRLHLCKAACCRLSFALSREDVDEGTLRWDFREPYMIAQANNGYCAHIDQQTYRCSVYDRRPVICRGYDCSCDDRIWIDFENKIINPQIHAPHWPEAIIESGSGADVV